MGRHLTAALAVFALVLAACGGGSDSGDSSKANGQTSTGATTGSPQAATTGATGSTGPAGANAQLPPARKALIARADKVCRKADVTVARLNRRIAKLNAKGGKSNVQQAAGLYGQAVGIGRQVVRDLSALEPPAADAAQYRRYLKAARDQVALIAEAQRALAKEDSSGFRLTEAQINAAKLETQSIAQQFGFKVCGVR